MAGEAHESVSVIIPVFNRPRYLEEALRSVWRQNPSPEEVIIVDDGSTDDTRKEAARFVPPARYIYQDHAGAAAARNTGIRMSKGSLIAFLDSDDVWTSEKMRIQKRWMDERPELDMIAGKVESFFSPDISETNRKKFRIPADPVSGFVASAVVIRRRVFDRLGGFPLDMELGEFIDWFLRAREAGMKYDVVPQVVARRRVHDNNMGVEKRDARGDYFRIVRAAMERRRRHE